MDNGLILGIPKNTLMTKNTYQKPSSQTQEEANKLAKSIQRPAQTKEQTKLVTQGIQQGIDLYKKQQKEKARELNKRLKKKTIQKNETAVSEDVELETIIIYRQHWLPWALLAVSWLGMVCYFLR
jgi:Protein of unknown function (DUF2956)